MSTPLIPDNAGMNELRRYVQELSRRVRVLEESNPQNTTGWAGNQTISAESRTFDSSTVTLPQLANVVGTMARDLVNTRTFR